MNTTPQSLRSNEMTILEHRLENEAERLRDHIASLKMFGLKERLPGAADVAAERDEQLVRRRLTVRRARRALRRTEAALRRMRDGTFGTCQRCGKPIDPDRLRVVPTATTCVACADGD